MEQPDVLEIIGNLETEIRRLRKQVFNSFLLLIGIFVLALVFMGFYISSVSQIFRELANESRDQAVQILALEEKVQVLEKK